MRSQKGALKKRQIEIAVISNIHLGAESCRGDALIAYLSSIDPKILVLNGRVLEAPANTRVALSSAQSQILNKLFKMAAAGSRIYYIYGRRDALVRTLEDQAGGNVYFTKNLFLNLNGKRAWFTHGDFLESSLLGKNWVKGLGTAGIRFLAVLIILKNLIGNSVLRHPTQVQHFPKTDYPNRHKNMEAIRASAVKLARGRGCEYLICGSPHHLSNVWLETNMGKCQYLSAGDWIQSLTALEYNFKRWKPYRYNEDKLSPFFADEDLKQMNVGDILSNSLKTPKPLAG